MKSAYIFFVLFFMLIIYLSYFLLFSADKIVNNPYNKRQDAFVENVIRGKIFSSSYDILAETQIDESGNETRIYPYGDLFAQTVGYNTNGKLGLELQYNYNLLTSNANIFEKFINEFQDEKNIGDNIITTFDVGLQKKAYDAIGNYTGAVVVIDPSTGEVLSMVSKPDFDPNQIADIYDTLISDENETSLNNRATLGLYTPGSTFKMFTLLEYMRQNQDYSDYLYECTGSIIAGDASIGCYNNTVHGSEDLISSFSNSCNTSFINLGLSLNVDIFNNDVKKWLFNKSLPVEFPYSQSKFSLDSDSGEFMTAQTVMGQGETLVTPLHMAMFASSVANNGVLMEPYMIKYIENYQGTIVEKFNSKEYGNLLTKEEAEVMKTYMRDVVLSGTAKELNSDLYNAYGKTGTAELNSQGLENSWFVGFAEKDGRQIAVAIVFENVYPGQKYGVIAAKQIFDEYFNS